MEKKSIVSQRLGLIRNKKGLTQQELAEKLGFSRDTITKWENGERQIKATDLAKICEALDCSADYLIGRTKEPTTDKDTQFVIDYTGLTENTVCQLKNLNNVRELNDIEGTTFSKFILNFVNLMFENDKGDSIYYNMMREVIEWIDAQKHLEIIKLTHLDDDLNPPEIKIKKNIFSKEYSLQQDCDYLKKEIKLNYYEILDYFKAFIKLFVENEVNKELGKDNLKKSGEKNDNPKKE